MNCTNFYDFPSDLAQVVQEKWDNFIMGEYTAPLKPNDEQLRLILETVYLAGLETDESRTLKFNLCCIPKSSNLNIEEIEFWPFSKNRPFNVQEIRRLATTADFDTATIWVEFDENSTESLSIKGLINLGSQWSISRQAYSYVNGYLPHFLIVRNKGLGKIDVYQGKYRIIGLESGKITNSSPVSTLDLSGANHFFSLIQEKLRKDIINPKKEHAKEWYSFEWTAIINVILAIINTIQLNGHGGALILQNNENANNLLRIKYKLNKNTDFLKKSFVKFINTRHEYGDLLSEINSQESHSDALKQKLSVLDYKLSIHEKKLSDTCRFVGNLSGSDGAIIIGEEFEIIGFGTEILIDKIKKSKVYKVNDTIRKDMEEGDSEQFGMRHRSAMQLCAVNPEIAVFVVSEDGGVTLVWNYQGKVCYKPGIKITNANMLLA